MAEKASRRQSTSQAKIEANRRNSLNSTGPKTVKGRCAVKWNALKHGLLAKEAVIDSGDGKENRGEFNNLLTQLREDLNPCGTIEEILVEKIAVSYWRLCRVQRAEIGEIRKQLNSVVRDTAIERSRTFVHTCDLEFLQDTQLEFRKTSMGAEYLIDKLEDIRCEVEQEGCLSDDTLQEVVKYLGRQSGTAGHTLVLYSFMAADVRKNPSDKSLPDPEKLREAMLQLINEQLENLRHVSAYNKEYEGFDLQARRNSLNIPDKAVTEKILRYESAIERQLYRALHELIRLQAARLGDKPLAPVAIDLDVSPGD